jgi:hypothetical protein
VAPDVLFHFSEDPTITRFVPHVPRTNPDHPPAVWAIDAAHAPLYWFPRECPRVTVWPRNADEAADFRQVFGTDAPRVHAFEAGWLDRVRTADVHRYEFSAADFAPWQLASGQWIADHEVEPLSISPVGDLLEAHVRAGIELRIVPSLWPLHDLAFSDRWDFSMVRMANATAR